MATAMKQFRQAMDKLKRIYKKRGRMLYWIRNIERGTKGAWHIHFVINDIGDTASLIERVWQYGGVFVTQIRKSMCPEEDFKRLAAYLTKMRIPGKRKRWYSGKAQTSGNKLQPFPEHASSGVETREAETMAKGPGKPKKGYYIAESFEGINPVTGYKYRRYTMIRLNRRI
ncbi:MAG: hypothetical protein ACLVBP_16445 [Ruminococcus sp.]